ncbi:putative glutamyl-tRNA amidotransferase subunit A [Xylariaceae sp. FL1272]|nr:putative glutamyl-tRNA amidotransferase subunit A [Xylariaceae sp. FL1272]
MPQFNVLTSTATDLEDLLNKGEATSEQIVLEYLRQIETYNGYLHAVISIAPREILLARSRQLDEERSGGKIRGPLHGIPILIKDNTNTHPDLGMGTTSGTYALVGSRVRGNAAHVEQLIAAGVIVIGKTNLSVSWHTLPQIKTIYAWKVRLNKKQELSNYRGSNMPSGWSAVGGLTQSPYVVGGKRWNDGCVGHSAPGGSSSGSCVGVAAGFAPIATGTDTNASLRSPATRNDVYALKPTVGLVSQDGICPISSDFDSAGPVARCARDIATILDAMVTPDETYGIPNETYTSELTGTFKGFRTGVLDPSEWHLDSDETFHNQSFDDQVDHAVKEVYKKLKLLGVVVKDVSLPPVEELKVDGTSQLQRVMDSQFQATLESYLQELETSNVHTLSELIQYMRDHPDLEFPEDMKGLRLGDGKPNMKHLEAALSSKTSKEEYKKALEDVREFGRNKSTDKCLRENSVDIILGRADSNMNDYYVAAGYPMAILPLSYAKSNGRPFGVCAIASAYQEGLLIRFMSAWEKVFNRNRQLPTWIGGHPAGTMKN